MFLKSTMAKSMYPLVYICSRVFCDFPLKNKNLPLINLLLTKLYKVKQFNRHFARIPFIVYIRVEGLTEIFVYSIDT